MITKKIDRSGTGEFQVYWLIDGITKKPFYVGVTGKTLECRLEGHFNAARRLNVYPVHEFIVSNHYNVTIELVERFDRRKDAGKAECYWIHQLNAWGFSIVNVGKLLSEKRRRMYPTIIVNKAILRNRIKQTA